MIMVTFEHFGGRDLSLLPIDRIVVDWINDDGPMQLSSGTRGNNDETTEMYIEEKTSAASRPYKAGIAPSFCPHILSTAFFMHYKVTSLHSKIVFSFNA